MKYVLFNNLYMLTKTNNCELCISLIAGPHILKFSFTIIINDSLHVVYRSSTLTNNTDTSTWFCLLLAWIVIIPFLSFPWNLVGNKVNFNERTFSLISRILHVVWWQGTVRTCSSKPCQLIKMFLHVVCQGLSWKANYFQKLSEGISIKFQMQYICIHVAFTCL